MEPLPQFTESSVPQPGPVGHRFSSARLCGTLLSSLSIALMLVAGSAVEALARDYTIGDRGEAVRAIQRRLGVPVTGFYGEETAAAVQDFQSRRRLNCVDGIAGPETLPALGLEEFASGFNSCVDGRRVNNDDFFSRDEDDFFASGSGFSGSAPYIVAIPGEDRRELNRTQDIVGDAFIDRTTSRFGVFIRAGSFSSHQRAREQSRALRRRGLDARVIYGPLGR